MSFDVTTLGELVVDLVPFRSSEGLTYIAKPGGAPANVAAGVSRLGHPAAMISKVGTESFGETALAALEGTGVDTSGVIRDPAHNTALAVVSETPTGETDFFFYRENCADSNLSAEEIPDELIATSKVLHVGTLPFATPISAAAQRHALALAKTNSVIVSTDPNFRAAFWRDLERMRAAGLELVKAANIVKVSADELRVLTGNSEVSEGVRSLWHPNLLVVAVTRGAAGAMLFTREAAVSIPRFAVTVADTVGCGDAFTAALLASLTVRNFSDLHAEALMAIGRRCCAAGAIIAGRSGALESMPTAEEIDRLIAAGG